MKRKDQKFIVVIKKSRKVSLDKMPQPYDIEASTINNIQDAMNKAEATQHHKHEWM